MGTCPPRRSDRPPPPAPRPVRPRPGRRERARLRRVRRRRRRRPRRGCRVVSLGPLRPVDPQTGLDADDPLAALTPADRAWLDRMADGLPRSMPVAGSSRWLLVRTDPAIVGPAIR